jgi:transcriptional regulator GlxA family with amidase domain
MTRKIIFIIPPNVELLDLAGPLQVFREAQLNGLDIKMEYYSFQYNIVSAAGLAFAEIEHYRNAQLREGDFLFIPGLHIESLERDSDTEVPFLKWLQICSANNVNICSVCNAAFILGEAGLLDNKECTTHWRSVGLLQQLFPNTKVLDDVLFVKSGNIYTSAGISAGIDMALDILESLKGALFTHQVARGLVIYQRRSNDHSQASIYLDYRNHINPKVHEVQDYLIKNIDKENSIENLASIVAMSPRNLTRVFKKKTGITVLEYITKLRIERARTLVNDPDNTIEAIAAKCGFKNARQLQRILKNDQNEN